MINWNIHSVIKLPSVAVTSCEESPAHSRYPITVQTAGGDAIKRPPASCDLTDETEHPDESIQRNDRKTCDRKGKERWKDSTGQDV